MPAATQQLARATRILVMEAGASRFGLSLESVVEIMRPLPLETIPRSPAYTLGMAIVRGTALPVIALKALLSGDGPDCGSRFVVVAVGVGRKAVLAVDAVAGVRDLPAGVLAALPPIMGPDASESVRAVAAHDRELLVLLEAARLVPEDVWTAGEAPGEA